MSNITQVVNFDKTLKIAKKGIHASDVDQLLSSSGPFTFFAPTDTAFEKLKKGLMDDLLEPQNRSKLANLMSNHIVKGKVQFKELKDGDALTTVNGKELLVHVKDGNVSIADASIQPRDVKVMNGVIYALDTVIL
jgi:uncharacterized surface protein with fasciclin (FAS1) repeats